MEILDNQMVLAENQCILQIQVLGWKVLKKEECLHINNLEAVLVFRRKLTVAKIFTKLLKLFNKAHHLLIIPEGELNLQINNFQQIKWIETFLILHWQISQLTLIETLEMGFILLAEIHQSMVIIFKFDFKYYLITILLPSKKV